MHAVTIARHFVSAMMSEPEPKRSKSSNTATDDVEMRDIDSTQVADATALIAANSNVASLPLGWHLASAHDWQIVQTVMLSVAQNVSRAAVMSKPSSP